MLLKQCLVSQPVKSHAWSLDALHCCSLKSWHAQRPAADISCRILCLRLTCRDANAEVERIIKFQRNFYYVLKAGGMSHGCVCTFSGFFGGLLSHGGMNAVGS